MDIFKLLSRSTKLAGKTSNSTTLPSSGTASNPQLYNDPVDSRGTKRKRTDVQGKLLASSDD